MTRRICISAFVLFLGATLAHGMIKTLTIPDLVRKAQVICIAKVAQQSEISVSKEQISTIKNVLLPEKVLKGDWPANEPIVIMTKKCGESGQIGWLEDQVEFPPKGYRVILFLEKADDGSLRTVNLVQGMWPLDKTKPLGMGIGTTLAQVEDLIKAQKN